MRRFISNAPVGFVPTLILLLALFLACVELIEEDGVPRPVPDRQPVQPTPISQPVDNHEESRPPGYAEAIPPEDVPPGPDPAELLSVSDIAYERENGSVSALISLDTGGINPEWGHVLEVHWSDGEITTAAPKRIVLGRDIIEIAAARDDGPDDLSVNALFFERVTFDLGVDEDATVYEDRIETEWGDFPVLEIIELDDSSGAMNYAAAGRRVIYRSVLDHHGTLINFATTAYARGGDLIPVDMQLRFSTGFTDALPDFPLPAEIGIREIAGNVLVEVE